MDGEILFKACRSGDLKTVIKCCHSDNFQKEWITSRYATGLKALFTQKFPLYVACSKGNLEVVKFLLSFAKDFINVNQRIYVWRKGVKIGFFEEDKTSLHIASKKQHTEIVQLLLDFPGINTKIFDFSKKFAIDYAKKERIREMIRGKSFYEGEEEGEVKDRDKNLLKNLVKARETEKSKSLKKIIASGTKESILKAMKENLEVLSQASEDIKNDEEFVLICVKEFGADCLKYCDEKLLKNESFLKKAVSTNGMTIQYIIGSQFANDEMMISALNQNFDSRIHIAKFLFMNDQDQQEEGHEKIIKLIFKGLDQKMEKIVESAEFGFVDDVHPEIFWERVEYHESMGKYKQSIQDCLLFYSYHCVCNNIRPLRSIQSRRSLSVTSSSKPVPPGIIPRKCRRKLISLFERLITNLSIYQVLMEKKSTWVTNEIIEMLTVKRIEKKNIVDLDKKIEKGVSAYLLNSIFSEISSYYRDDFKFSDQVQESHRKVFDDILQNMIRMECKKFFWKHFGYLEDSQGKIHQYGLYHPVSGKINGPGFEFKEIEKGLFNKKVVLQSIFYGTFSEGRRHGDKCREFDPVSGFLLFEGSFRDGKREGNGIEYEPVSLSSSSSSSEARSSRSSSMFGASFHSSMNIVFEGSFKNNLRHGRGEEYDTKECRVRRGTWINGILDPTSIKASFECPQIRYGSISKHLGSARVIGQGAFGIIYECDSKDILKYMKKVDTKKIPSKLAVKIIKVDTTFHKMMVLRIVKRGIGLTAQINSRHILPTYGMIQGSREVGYLMKLCEGGDVSSVIGKGKEVAIPMKEKIRFLKETAIAVRDLHSQNVMHRDLKWGNVLLDGEGSIQLTDFDTLKEDEIQWRLSTIQQSSNIGTPGFLATEVYLGKKYSLKCDVFAFGLMIYALLWELNLPYTKQYQCVCGTLMSRIFRTNSLDSHVARCNLRPLLDQKYVEKFPSFLIDLMIQCWDQNPFNRPHFEDICQRFEYFHKEWNFTTVTLQFSDFELKDQKVFLPKPFRLSQVENWVYQKFSGILSEKKEEEEEEEGEEGDDNNMQKESFMKSIRFDHSVLGLIDSDELLGKLVEKEETPVLIVSFEESFVSKNNVKFEKILGVDEQADASLDTTTDTFKKEFETMKKENEKLKEEVERLQKIETEKKELEKEILELRKKLGEE